MPLHYAYSYDAYRAHWLFRVMRSAVIRRSGGVCERCNDARATQVHHESYPAWGAFDTPGNMQAVCHACHEKAHGKEPK